ncbi:MAG: hypothetical protein H7Z43_12410 [Clostridia bacterium]|nr:hypothetical protein [Deltaproteobacteria bacterium]
MKGSLAGVMQIPADPINNGDTQHGFDGFPVVIKLANDRARLCRIEASLKLADRMMNTYEVQLVKKNSNCLLLLELTSKTAILRDHRGQCGPALCGEMKIDGYTMAFDASRRTCMAKPSEKPAPELPPAPPKASP